MPLAFTQEDFLVNGRYSSHHGTQGPEVTSSINAIISPRRIKEKAVFCVYLKGYSLDPGDGVRNKIPELFGKNLF